jgi:hypothetical protein
VDQLPVLIPHWTSKSPFSLGRDPLGIQATSVRMYQSMVPGLTNVTNRLRYYSFYCWLVRYWGREEHRDSTKGWRNFVRRAEALYAIASLVADRDASGGMAGREWAEDIEMSLSDGRKYLDLSIHDDATNKDSYLGAVSGNFGQFYVSSMEESGMLKRSRSVVPVIDDTAGRPLADAFVISVGPPANLFTNALKNGRVAIADLGSIGQAMGPMSIPDPSTELALLRGFLGGDAGGHRATSRRSSAWLVLDYMRLVGSKLDEKRFRRSF